MEPGLPQGSPSREPPALYHPPVTEIPPQPTDPTEPALSTALTAAGAQFIPWGDSGAHIAEHFDAFEAEYAALRQRVGVLHLPHRGVLELRGADVKDYLHRLCTQNINDLSGGQSTRAFQLNERGQVTADLRVHHGDNATWLEADADDLPPMAELILARQFTEDLTLTERIADYEMFWLLGPASVQLLAAAATDPDAATPVGAMPDTHHVIDLTAAPRVTAYRCDLGELLGIRLIVRREHAAALYRALLQAAGHEQVDPATLSNEAAAAFAERRRGSLRGRPIGWSALNTVRIEEGVPQYHIDFGPTSLPAEVPGPHGIDAAVSFTKGCYLGQEVVARMKSLGHPKKLLVGLKVDAVAALPIAGAQIFDADDPTRIIGALTSSAASPLAGQAAVGFAVVRWGRHRPGTRVRVPADGQMIDAVVGPLTATADPT